MGNADYSKQIQKLTDLSATFTKFYLSSRYSEKARDAAIYDFVAGNPQEMPLQSFTQALQRWAEPQEKSWFGYKMSEPEATRVVAASLNRRFGQPFEPEDICMTNGAFTALSASLGAVVDPGDEVIYISPPWFFYTMLITAHHGVPVQVGCDKKTFDLDLEAIERAITPRTRGIIINSPNNPTGKIYPPQTLRRLADILEKASRKNGRAVYLFSDEAYREIVYDRREFHSPAEYYPSTFILYTYGKQLLTPGQRLGYIAIPPAMPGREDMRGVVLVSQIATGFGFPNALLQHALVDLAGLSIDIARLQARRDRMVPALQDMGYDLHSPEGTFYLLVRSPLSDDLAFIDLLADQNIYCLPGATFEMPGYFRISLTANDEMVEKSLPGFAAALQKAAAASPVPSSPD